MDLNLHGKRALVTGAYRGTGQRIAARLLDEGCEVFVHGFDADATTAACREIGGGAAVVGDITTDEGARAVLAACTHVDILVNNYGTAGRGDWETSAWSDWADMYEKNVLSAARMAQGVLTAMRDRGWGRIINLGTVGSTRPAARMPHYYAAKGALATMTVSLAKAAGSSGITVNLVSPGLIQTAEVEAQYLARGRELGWGDTWAEVEPHVAADIPIGRIVRRDEVADLVAFLASPRAGAIHGQNIRIDGGALGTLT